MAFVLVRSALEADVSNSLRSGANAAGEGAPSADLMVAKSLSPLVFRGDFC